jgi:hypothetical protein
MQCQTIWTGTLRTRIRWGDRVAQLFGVGSLLKRRCGLLPVGEEGRGGCSWVVAAEDFLTSWVVLSPDLTALRSAFGVGGPVSHPKPSHDPTFRLDLLPCFRTWTIAELDAVCEQGAHAVQHAISLTRQLESSQITQVGSIDTTSKTYITPSMRADLHRETGWCSSVHCCVEISNN